MITIYKYALGAHYYKLPKDAQFLCVHSQADSPRLWFLVNTDAALEQRRFICYATGEEIDNTEKLKYLGTFFIGSHERLVYHVFEILQHLPKYNTPQ